VVRIIINANIKGKLMARLTEIHRQHSFGGPPIFQALHFTGTVVENSRLHMHSFVEMVIFILPSYQNICCC
jgi:hypothetical protein